MYIKIYPQIPIDPINLEVKPSIDSGVLSISSVSKSMRIHLSWSLERYIHSSVLYHRYIYHLLYRVILSTVLEALPWSRREQAYTLDSEGGPRQSRTRGSTGDTSVTIHLIRYYSFCWDETILLFPQDKSILGVVSLKGSESCGIQAGCWYDTQQVRKKSESNTILCLFRWYILLGTLESCTSVYWLHKTILSSRYYLLEAENRTVT